MDLYCHSRERSRKPAATPDIKLFIFPKKHCVVIGSGFLLVLTGLKIAQLLLDNYSEGNRDENPMSSM